MKQSPRWYLNDQQKALIKYILIHGLIGIVVTVWGSIIAHMNFGQFSPFAYPMISTIVSFITASGYSYASGPTQQDLKIQELEQKLSGQAPSAN